MSDFEQPVEPMSRAEAILRKYGDVTPMSRVEDLLKELVDESGGSDVTVTPVLSDGVRLATIGVDGTDYNIYAPEDVVGSIVSVTTEYNTGTLLATITVNDVDHYIYVPEFESGALYGFIDPTTLLGSDKDIYFKYNGDNVISEWMNGGSFNPPTQHSTYDIVNSFGRDISNDYEIEIAFTVGRTPHNWTILVSDITTSWTIKEGDWSTGFSGIRINPNNNKYELHTNASSQHMLRYKTNEFTPISIDSVWHKTGAVWHKNKSYQEITKAEYDALPNSKLTDDILYCITDGGATKPGEYYNPVIYSLIEREVGVWTDGRPLYEKTYAFKFTDLENKTISSSVLMGYYSLPHEEYDRIWVHDGLIKCVPKAEGGASETSLKGTPLNYSAGNTYTRTNVQRRADLNDSYPLIFIENTYGASELHKIVNDLDVYVVLRYTKTTDTPGSGKYTTLGVPSVHYSTDEQVIGTWIDGKPLYQITRKIENDELWADFTYYGLRGTTNLDFVAVKEATFVDPSNSVYASLPYHIPSTNNYIEVSMNVIDSVKRLTIRTNTTFSATTGRYIVATIIYTKTTD